MRAFLNWATSKQLLEKNPIEKARRPFKTSERDRVLSDDELAQILRASNDSSHFSRIIQLLIYTAQRRTEIGALRWEYISERDKTITWPKEATKSARQHTIPYTDAVQDTLARIPRTSPFLFPSLNPAAPFSQWSLGMRKLRAACDIPLHFQINDFRRTAARNLARCGTPPHIVERILNHSAGQIKGVAAVYNRWAYLEEMRDALEKYNQLVRAIAAQSADSPNLFHRSGRRR
jgi:integrase